MKPLLLATISLVVWVKAACGDEIYSDDFDSDTIAGNIHAIAGAALDQSNGQLTFSTSSPGQGLSVGVPTNDILCFTFTYSAIAPAAPLQTGDQMVWRWIVTDPTTGTEYVLLESQWTKENSTRFTTRKRNASGRVVRVHQEVAEEDLDFLPPPGQHAKVKWDRRTVGGREQVQLELVLVAPRTGRVTKYVKVFPWQDPDDFESTRFEVTASFPLDMVFESLTGDDEHQLVQLPAWSPWSLVILSAALFVSASLVIRKRHSVLSAAPERSR